MRSNGWTATLGCLFVLGAATGLGGCLVADQDGGGALTDAADGVAKAAEVIHHGALAPGFGYQVIANAQRVHTWTYAATESISAPILVRRAEAAPRVAYLNVYELDAAGGRTAIDPQRAALDIVNAPSPRMVAFEAGKTYELELVRRNPADAVLNVSLGDFGEDGRTDAMPDYFFDLAAGPQLTVLSEELYTPGYDLSAAYAGLRAQALGLANLEGQVAADAPVLVHELRYGGFRMIAMMVDYPEGQAGALFVQDLVDLTNVYDDGDIMPLRVLGADGYMTPVAPDSPAQAAH